MLLLAAALDVVLDAAEKLTTRIAKYAPYIVILGALLSIVGWWVILGAQKDVQRRLSREDIKLSHLEAKLSSIVHESSSTRVITVSSRCELDRALATVLPELGASASQTTPFKANRTGCLKQLAEVRQIAAR